MSWAFAVRMVIVRQNEETRSVHWRTPAKRRWRMAYIRLKARDGPDCFQTCALAHFNTARARRAKGVSCIQGGQQKVFQSPMLESNQRPKDYWNHMNHVLGWVQIALRRQH